MLVGPDESKDEGQTLYYGSDGFIQTTSTDAISASAGFESSSGGSQGSTGGCRQSAYNASDYTEDKKDN